MQKAGLAEALKAEVYRVQVEVLRRQEERTAAQQEFRVATAELARLLRLDPATPLWPIEDFTAMSFLDKKLVTVNSGVSWQRPAGRRAQTAESCRVALVSEPNQQHPDCDPQRHPQP